MAMNGCAGEEADYWYGVVSNRFDDLLVIAEARDADLRQIGSKVQGHVTATKQMQAAWREWRDAVCRYEATDMLMGTGASSIESVCRTELALDHLIYIERRLANERRSAQ
ncbi:lysozyme inhibitor LprI family protein [Pseudaestuariivita rosea]|uniref:lysozyme inhibitor LprI family protein n=1 Tax=Pseudaestuariivita rosea TaxID=2763263 RepID=UPI003013B678